MKKTIISGALALSCLFATAITETDVLANEKSTVWDGAEIVKNQTGKMTFSKDVKVYKKNAKGKFVSLVVPKGDFFKVYDVEKYGGETFYWMSSGYRVKKTDLVVFKAIPIEIRGKFFKNPVSVNISRNPIDVTYTNADAVSTPPEKQKRNVPYGEVLNLYGDCCLQSYHTPKMGDGDMYKFNDPTDIKLVEAETKVEAIGISYRVKEDALIYDNPFGVKTVKTIPVKKDTVVKSGVFHSIINGYLWFDYGNRIGVYISMEKLEKVN